MATQILTKRLIDATTAGNRDDSKTGKSVRPLASDALAILKTQKPEGDCAHVFASKDGTNFYLGTKRYWVKVVKLANLPGVTPRTLRHTIGSAAVSTGETLSMTGALLGHATSIRQASTPICSTTSRKSNRTLMRFVRSDDDRALS
jgi:integrase